MDGASVQLVATRGQKDTVISGQITGRHGDFSLENLPLFGNFRLRITAIGFKTYEQKVAFDLKGLRGAGAAPGGGVQFGFVREVRTWSRHVPRR